MTKSRAPPFHDLGIPVFEKQPGMTIAETAERHPDMRPFLVERPSGRLDLVDRAGLLLYNKYLALDVYGLDIEFGGAGSIIPTPVLRYSFLHYLLRDSPTLAPVMIELGTGASAIIALLAAKHFNATVYATEVESEYIVQARANIDRNGFSDRVFVLNSRGLLLNGVVPEGLQADYIISNPPYYDEIRSPKVLWGGAERELVGGSQFGEQFIARMVHEGWAFLNTPGIISFIIPKTRQDTLGAVCDYLSQNRPDYDIFGIKTGNRTRYVFRVYKRFLEDRELLHEME